MINYSQCHQDIFVKIINEDLPGFFIDIGCNKPDWINNTQLLREEKWYGVSIDKDDYSKEWEVVKESLFIKCDATIQSELQNAFLNVPRRINYLSMDIDADTLKALENIDFEWYKFKCITIEHNSRHGDIVLQKGQRKILKEKGYYLLVEDLNGLEDWWVHPELVDISKYMQLKTQLETISKKGFFKKKIKDILMTFLKNNRG